MRFNIRLTLAALAATAVLGAAAGIATAGRLSISSQTFRFTWQELEFIGFDATVSCEITMEGSFHSRTISKVRNTLVGYITRATVNDASCNNGRIRTLELPWHIRYASFTGTLPTIFSINLNVIAGFLIESRMILVNSGCLYRSTTERPMVLNITRNSSGGELVAVEPKRENEIPLVTALFGQCPTAVRPTRVSHDATILNATTEIRVTLI